MGEPTKQMGLSGLEAALGTVADAMTKNVVTVTSDLSVTDALAMLDREGVGGAPVVEGDRVVGVVTVSDLLDHRASAQRTGPFLRPHHGNPDWRVADVMAEGVVTVSPADPLAVAVVKMEDRKVDRLPVLGPNGRPVGILARDDVVRAVARAIRRSDDTPRQPFLLPD